jgi:ATP-dependent DNA helicase DinG
MRLEQVFSETGPLATKLSGFNPRPQQTAMALAIAETLESRSTFVAEAGTGTGKTLAYLVPAILSGKKVLISTATKTLQDQLFRKDLPGLRRALDIPFRAALLKGRSNYLCLYRQKNHLGFKAGLGGRDSAALESIRRWSRTTLTGDISELSDVPEGSLIWSGATSTVDNCLGTECPDHADCFLVRARSRARDADIVVVNHHLLWADWALRNEGQGELLPAGDGIIVDEAHQFLESAAQFLGNSLTSRQLLDLAADISTERVREAPDATQLQEEADRLSRLTHDVRIALGEPARRDSWEAVSSWPSVMDAMEAVVLQLSRLRDVLQPQRVRGKGLEACYVRSVALLSQIESFLKHDDPNQIQWFESRKMGFSLNRSPIEISDEFRQFRDRLKTAWVFTSATLTVRDRFDHFTHELGISGSRVAIWNSPFDFNNSARLYLPQGLPDPASSDYTQKVVQAAVPALEASRGRAFFLFTSHQALQAAAAMLPQFVHFPLFIQGTQPKTRLLEAFKQSTHGILLGTATFWEGVDVPGPALSLVIIDKLPFGSPGDPVTKAKLDALRAKGLSPFPHYQLPSAIITLKQGVGRLLRGHADKGGIMLCDPRLRSKSYGKTVLESLPPIPLTTDLSDFTHFLESLPASTT